MADLVDPKSIEGIVGVPRHSTDHLGRAVTREKTVYILHSQACRNSVADLRTCPFSIALDRGVTDRLPWASWRRVPDRPVRLHIHHDGWLVPDLLALRWEPDWADIATGRTIADGEAP